MKRYQTIALSLSLLCGFASLGIADDQGDPPVRAPFTDVDTLCINDWWNRKPSEIIDPKVPREEEVAFGIYTVANDTLKLSAQLLPLYPSETREVRLEV